jgi:Ca-activated chloride channel family protein
VRQRHGVAYALARPLLLLIAPALLESQALEPYRVAVNVDLVELHATVRDRQGHFVSDLRQQDFEVYEEGVRQSIRLFRHEDIPVTVGLVVDHSGSMREKLADVVAAARTFVQSSSPQDEMFVVNFNEHVTLGLPAAIRFTNRSQELARAISNAPATGQTALYDALVEANVRLQTGSRNKKVLIVISDGGDNASTHTMGEVLMIAEKSSALMYTVGIFDDEDPDRNPGVLKRLAQATGGEAIFPEKLSAVVAASERIARDIRHQYTLGYVSSNTARTGGFRAIRVVARMPGKGRLAVRTRNGYIAAGEPQSLQNRSAK